MAWTGEIQVSDVIRLPVRPVRTLGMSSEAGQQTGLSVSIVDDAQASRQALMRLLSGLSEIGSICDFDGPASALEWFADHDVDLILLDYHMPGMDGLELARSVRMLPHHRYTPIVLVTADNRAPVRQAAMEAGIVDVLVKPVRPRELQARCLSLLQLRQESHAARGRMRELEIRLMASLHEVESRERETLVRLARAIEFRDAGTSAYLERMSLIAALIARTLGLPEDEVRMIEAAAPLHDLGKIAIPDAVLLKPGKLDEGELAVMRRHPLIGHELLADSQNRAIQLAGQIALGHHERFDGTGYPAGLVGEEIPLAARIVAVADVFDALLSPRPYKEAWSVDDALTYLQEQSGKHFDPRCVAALMARRDEACRICDEHSTASRRPAAM